jgi:hypothetical protein
MYVHMLAGIVTRTLSFDSIYLVGTDKGIKVERLGNLARILSWSLLTAAGSYRELWVQIYVEVIPGVEDNDI